MSQDPLGQEVLRQEVLGDERLVDAAEADLPGTDELFAAPDNPWQGDEADVVDQRITTPLPAEDYDAAGAAPEE